LSVGRGISEWYGFAQSRLTVKCNRRATASALFGRLGGPPGYAHFHLSIRYRAAVEEKPVDLLAQEAAGDSAHRRERRRKITADGPHAHVGGPDYGARVVPSAETAIAING